MTEWRTIDSAPKDGTEILAFARTHEGSEMYQVVYWDDAGSADYAWKVTDGPSYYRAIFIYWQPLPPPPSIPDKEG